MKPIRVAQAFLAALLLTITVAFGVAYPEVTLQVLQHVAFATWTVFLFWFGIGARWNETQYGVNTMIASAAFWLILLLVQISIFWPDAEWRQVLRLPIYLLIVAAGLQRVWFMAHRPPADRTDF